MEVGLVVPDDLETTSGGYRYDRRLVAELRARGDDVEVIALSAIPDGAVRANLDRPFDVLLQDELCYDSLAAPNDVLGAPERVVALVHNLQSDDPSLANRDRARVRQRERRYLETVDAAVCTSGHTRDRVCELVDLPATVAHPAGRHETPPIDRATVADRARTGELRIAFVGSLVPRKGLDALIEALAAMDRDWQLTVVGREADPEYAAAVREQAAALGIDDRIAFEGRVPDGVLESVYERSHVLAVPSRYEAFGMVYLEAMEYGVVPVAGRNGGAGEFVADGENGFLADPGTPAHVAELLDELAADRERLAALGERARETAAAHPWWDDAAKAVRSFLLNVLEDGAETPAPFDRGGTDA
ncbi:glycosyltransferase family 4 protein [Natronococcus occultus]|uniref:Glycosyltransferase n=1 Tax=Natronococcus occultus SP4 TaxID=694430 RepID=L0JZC5_9EURY|nr:glycosyltransferase family 4 protein [Natronococcus occultus]AGB37449.1 glycosyltransferase [Natronococcus occultus SP4]